MKRLAVFHSLVSGKKCILPEDIADYISSIYMHRINQAVLKINSVEAKVKMDEIKNNVLSIKRPKI